MTREWLKCMVNATIEELMILDMEPKPEFLWRPSTCTPEDGLTSEVGGGGKNLGDAVH